MDWPKRRRHYAALRTTLRRLKVADRGVDAGLAELFTTAQWEEQADVPGLPDGSLLPAYTASRQAAAILWFECLQDEPIPQGGAIFICQRLVEEAAELFE